jgi:hypothetical protein
VVVGSEARRLVEEGHLARGERGQDLLDLDGDVVPARAARGEEPATLSFPRGSMSSMAASPRGRSAASTFCEDTVSR